MSNVHVTLHPAVLEYTQNKVSTMAYGSKSEVINEALRRMMQDDIVHSLHVQRLHQEITKGLQDLDEGHSAPLNADAIFQQALGSNPA